MKSESPERERRGDFDEHRRRSYSRSPSRRRHSHSPRRDRSPPGRDRERGDRSPPPPRRDRSVSPRRDRDRSPRRDRDRSPRRDRSRDRSRSRSPRRDRDRRRSRSRSRSPRRYGGKPSFRELAAQEASRKSRKDCRVYVGNLSFGVKWNDLKDFMREAGNVVFSEIMALPNGMSKGCGVVEYSTPEEAQKAIRELNDQTLLGRPLFIREDREDEARYGNAAISSRAGRGDRPPPREGRTSAANAAPPGESRNLFVNNLPETVGWQDLKDLFRAAGTIVRADVKIGHDGVSSRHGTVVFENIQDAQNAISMYNGFEYQGSVLEVREDRFPTAPPSSRGGRGGYGGFGRGGYSGRGGFQGGYDQFGFQSAFGGFSNVPFGPRGFAIPPSTQIFVKNLPWSTSNEDLIELFQTTGTVEEAEVLSEGGRSKGTGIVQFANVGEAEIAIAKFEGYSYGGRPLHLEFNSRFKDFGGAKQDVAEYKDVGMN